MIVKNKRSTAILLVVLMCLWVFPVSIAQAGTTCNDIQGHWAQSQIEQLIAQDILSGYPDNTFKPDNTINRAEFMAMVNRAFAYTNTTAADYSDVKDSDWFAAEIAKAKAAGYISGYEDNTMRPLNQISRQEVAKIISTVLKLDTSSSAGLNFTDNSNIPSWSYGFVAALVKQGLMKGYPDGSFQAAKSLTRAEAASIIFRAKDQTVKTNQVDRVVASVTPGVVSSGTKVSLSTATEGAVIYYTLDSTTPTSSSIKYTGPITIEKTTTIKAVAIKQGMLDSPLLVVEYLVSSSSGGGGGGGGGGGYIPDTVSAPTASPVAGEVPAGTAVVLTCATAGATIYYTTDGSEPTTSSTVYSTPIIVNKAMTIKAIASAVGMTTSSTAIFVYTITPAGTVSAPAATPAAGQVTAGTAITLSCATAGATIRYTIDGSEPTSSSTIYTAPIIVNTAMVIKAKAFVAGMNDSSTATFAYTIKPMETAAVPTASPSAGLVPAGTRVTLSCATAGAVIRYTTDGSEPTASSTQYTAPIVINTAVVIKAKAFAAGMNPSATASFAYTVGAVTRFDQAGTFGPASGSQTITGNVLIAVSDVTLRNTIITGDLEVAQSVGNGSVTLQNVTVQGNTYVKGGGANSIHVIDCGFATIIVDDENNTVRIVASGNTTVGNVELRSGATLEESGVTGTGFSDVSLAVNIPPNATVILEGNFGTVTSQAEGVKVEVPSGSINSLDLQAPAQVDVAGGSVGSLTVGSTAANANINVSGGSVGTLNVGTTASVNISGGTVSTVDIGSGAANTTVNIGSGGAVTNLTANAATQVTGTGTIGTATINSSGTTIEQTPSVTKVDPTVTTPVTVGGNTVQPGTQVDSNGNVSTYTGSGGSSGGSNGGGSNSVTIGTIEVTTSAGNVAVNNGSVSLAGKADSVRVTGLYIPASPANSTLVITQLNARGKDFITSSGTVSCQIPSNSTVSFSSIMAALDPSGDGVTLGVLRSIFGSGNITIVGYVSHSGYTNSATQTISMTLGAGGSAVTTIENQWVTTTLNNTTPNAPVITVTVKGGMGNVTLGTAGLFTRLAGLNENTSWPAWIQFPGRSAVSGNASAIQTEIAAYMNNGKTWNNCTLTELRTKLGANFIQFKVNSGGHTYKLYIN